MQHNINDANMVRVVDNRRPLGQRKPPAMPSHECPIQKDRLSLQENSGEEIPYEIPIEAASRDSCFSFWKELLVKILKEQRITTQIACEGRSYDFKDLTPEKARDLISEDGYLGAERTSDRIAQFALFISDNDPARLEETTASIDRGFQLASEALGGTLPEISMKTYEASMDKLHAFVEGFDKSESIVEKYETL